MRNRMIRIAALSALAVFACFVFWGTILAAQEQEETGHLVGFVYKKDGKTPIKDAQLILEEIEKGKKTGNKFESNVTDETGEYKMMNLPAGFYKGKILINKKHYKIKRLDFFVHIIAGETNFVSFSLKKK